MDADTISSYWVSFLARLSSESDLHLILWSQWKIGYPLTLVIQ